MDPTDSTQGRKKPSEQEWDSPPSSRGRLRKKNTRYSDYETYNTTPPPAAQRTSSRRSRAAPSPSKTPPLKTEEAKNASQQTAGGENAAEEKTAKKLDGKSPKETPQKSTRGRKKKTPQTKTPPKITPDRKTPKAVEVVPPPQDEAMENGTPKPKRKYVKRQKETPVSEPPREEVPDPPEEEIEPGGRRRRGAAKAAMRYLQILAKEVLDDPDPAADRKVRSESVTEQKNNKGRRGRKRKREFDSDAEDDEDFDPGVEKDEVEEMEEEEEGEEEEEESEDFRSDVSFGKAGRGPAFFNIDKNNSGPIPKKANGIPTYIMKGVWSAFDTTKKFREEHFSSWVFPGWVPSISHWTVVPQSDLEKYLPQETRSAAFKLFREGNEEETPLQRLSRFESVPAHPERWDMLLYAGGPVWAMEWCPTPEGAPATQYLALSCHRGMDDQHHVSKSYAGRGLIQLWDVGKLEYNCSPDSQPSLAYGIAQDKGFIWSLKWCPAGGWELPSCGRKAPFLPRLGLLAAATSTGVVTIYSLPHPDALHSNKEPPSSGNSGQQLPIYQAEGVLTLKLGSFKAPRDDKSGQVLSMDWLPEKPHNIMAIGFYDGIVGLWDLSTKSTLLRVRESDRSLSLMPYRCFLGHDHAVRALAFCPASRHLLVTAGEDRQVKTWDLRRLESPSAVHKRYLTNEICWPLNAPGVLMAQESAYVARGSQGVHYLDHYTNSVFAIPRNGTVWSISYTDWMNSVVSSDSYGEVIFSVLPQINFIPPSYIKRTIERRFPVYLTSMVPHDTTEEESPARRGGGGEEEEEEVEKEAESGNVRGPPPLRVPTYREAVKKFCLHHTDSDMRSFAGCEKRATWKHMRDTEMKATMNLDDMTLSAIHKVRFNPNMSGHTWLASAGQTGLVRLICLRSMNGANIANAIKDNQAQFSALYQDHRNHGAKESL